jgi:hypothetical protein
MPSTINSQSISKKVGRSKKFQNELNKKIKREIELKKQQLLAEFDAHPVTAEIQSGAESKNTSGTLGGYGNLYSYIGFKGGSPTQIIRDLLKSVYFKINPRQSSKKNRIIRTFSVTLPTKADIYRLTPMPWEGGSWAEGIEKGISGFSYYMYKKFGGSRSGYGLQADHNIGKAIFTPKLYITGILESFRKNVRSIK